MNLMWRSLKWEGKKLWRFFRVFLLVYGLLGIFLYLLPLKNCQWIALKTPALVQIPNLCYGIFGAFCLFYPLIRMTPSYGNGKMVTEKLTGVPPCCRILSRLVLNLPLSLLLIWNLQVGQSVMEKFSGRGVAYFQINLWKSWGSYLFDYSLFLPLVYLIFFLFFYRWSNKPRATLALIATYFFEAVITFFIPEEMMALAVKGILFIPLLWLGVRLEDQAE